MLLKHCRFTINPGRKLPELQVGDDYYYLAIVQAQLTRRNLACQRGPIRPNELFVWRYVRVASRTLKLRKSRVHSFKLYSSNLVSPRIMASYCFVFPEMIPLEEKPQPRGQPDKSCLNLRTPLYSYGWIIPQREVLNYVEKALASKMTIGPTNIEGAFKSRYLNPRWREMGFESLFKNQDLDQPKTMRIGKSLVLIVISSNATSKRIEAVHGNREYISACQKCIGPIVDAISTDPVWFRAGVNGCPEGYTQYDLGDDDFIY
ncbi:hypothetical protein CPB83DRAFT_884084 [Crepidotus variabilis]|uniref:Uncharacterized protein n=1 Tax=Crepidotus variabilis TaxID=179855 RepID=A0A9P6JNR5_9AGAR|nr:hypothetical protein CPB83DRAFT_884084 [Crepidotus variabilis]